MNNLQRFIALLREINDGQEPFIPYQLHDGIRTLEQAFGNHGLTADYLQKIEDANLRDQ